MNRQELLSTAQRIRDPYARQVAQALVEMWTPPPHVHDFKRRAGDWLSVPECDCGERQERLVCKYYPEPCPLPNVHCSAPDCKVPQSSLTPSPSPVEAQGECMHRFDPVAPIGLMEPVPLDCLDCGLRMRLVLVPMPEKGQA